MVQKRAGIGARNGCGDDACLLNEVGFHGRHLALTLGDSLMDRDQVVLHLGGAGSKRVEVVADGQAGMCLDQDSSTSEVIISLLFQLCHAIGDGLQRGAVVIPAELGGEEIGLDRGE